MKWYQANTSNDQGLIVEEKTGRNVAVSYKQEDAALLSAAPDLLEACKLFDHVGLRGMVANMWGEPVSKFIFYKLTAAIAKATAGEPAEEK